MLIGCVTVCAALVCVVCCVCVCVFGCGCWNVSVCLCSSEVSVVCVVGQCAVWQRAIGMQSNIHTNSHNYFSRTHAKLHVPH